jgi:hypothetical protein
VHQAWVKDHKALRVNPGQQDLQGPKDPPDSKDLQDQSGRRDRKVLPALMAHPEDGPS